MKINVDGVLRDMTEAELAENAPTSIAHLQAPAMRKLRDQLLAETDWTASSDLKMSDGMKAYRQALRDVPLQENFPEVTWPEFEGEPLAPVEEETEEKTEETTEEETEETTEETKESE